MNALAYLLLTGFVILNVNGLRKPKPNVKINLFTLSLLSLVFGLLSTALITSCTKLTVNPVVVKTDTLKIITPVKATDTVKIDSTVGYYMSVLKGNWSGTNKHYLYGAYDNTYNVKVAITDSTFVINYLDNGHPTNRSNPNIWNFTPELTLQFWLQQSATYKINVLSLTESHIILQTNNQDEYFELNK